MKYVAFLRGVNVGGNSLVKMSALKEMTEAAGFKNVRTVIQSGNIIFESDEKDSAKIEARLEKVLKKSFDINSQIVVKNHEQLKKVLTGVPAGWDKRNDIRFYIAFAKKPGTVADVLREAKPKEGIDDIAAGDGVVYMATLLSLRTKTGFTKLIGKPVYKEISLRYYNTVKKIADLMED